MKRSFQVLMLCAATTMAGMPAMAGSQDTSGLDAIDARVADVTSAMDALMAGLSQQAVDDVALSLDALSRENMALAEVSPDTVYDALLLEQQQIQVRLLVLLANLDGPQADRIAEAILHWQLSFDLHPFVNCCDDRGCFRKYFDCIDAASNLPTWPERTVAGADCLLQLIGCIGRELAPWLPGRPRRPSPILVPAN